MTGWLKAGLLSPTRTLEITMSKDSALGCALLLALGVALLTCPAFLPSWVPDILLWLATASGIFTLLLTLWCAATAFPSEEE